MTKIKKGLSLILYWIYSSKTRSHDLREQCNMKMRFDCCTYDLYKKIFKLSYLYFHDQQQMIKNCKRIWFSKQTLQCAYVKQGCSKNPNNGTNNNTSYYSLTTQCISYVFSKAEHVWYCVQWKFPYKSLH